MIFDVFIDALNPLVLIASLAGVMLGLVVGAVPGLGAVMAMSVLLPFTFNMGALPALVMLSAIYVGAMCGDVIPAVLMGIPGTPGSAADVLDGGPLAKQGRATEALNLSIFGSAFGGLFSILLFLICSAPLVKLSYNFGPPEKMWLAVLGLGIIASLSKGSMAKGVISAALGVFISMVGLDTMNGHPRFTFDNSNLLSGIPLIPPLVGLFAIARVLQGLEEGHLISSDGAAYQIKIKLLNVKEFLPSLRQLVSLIKTFIRGSVYGSLIGVLPGAGGDIAGWVAYDQEKKASKNPEKFGKGAIEGLVAAETGNSAVVGGALIPLLSLGIPGSAAAAVIYAGITVQGLAPGLELFTHHARLVYSLVVGLIIANIMVLFCGLIFRGFITTILQKTPSYMLTLVVTTSSIIGTYAIQNNVFHVYLMFIFGVLGYVMDKFEMPTSSMVLAIILGPMLEDGLRQSILLFWDNPLVIFYGSKGISAALVVLLIVTIFFIVFKKKGSSGESVGKKE